MPLPRIYVETSVFSYLASRDSRDLVVATQQHVTRQWWPHIASQAQLCVSVFVSQEAERGDSAQAKLRMDLVNRCAYLDINPDIERLAQRYFKALSIPERSRLDAFHIAVAAWHGVEYVASWNCKHIASARVQRELTDINAKSGLRTPVLCTPFELMEI